MKKYASHKEGQAYERHIQRWRRPGSAETGYSLHASSSSTTRHVQRLSGNSVIYASMLVLLPTPPLIYSGLQDPLCTAAFTPVMYSASAGPRFSRLHLLPTTPGMHSASPETGYTFHASPFSSTNTRRMLHLLPPPTPVMYSASAVVFFNTRRVQRLTGTGAYVPSSSSYSSSSSKQGIRSELHLLPPTTPPMYSAGARPVQQASSSPDNTRHIQRLSGNRVDR